VSWLKGDLVNEAFSELALAASVFDLTPSEQATALRRMDAMLATWAAKGVRIGYVFPSDPNGSQVTDDSGIPDSAAETVYTNLALRLAPGFGKQVPLDTRLNARQGYDMLLWNAAHPVEQQLPNTMPRGAGNKPWRRTAQPFMPIPDPDPLQYDDQTNDLDILPE